MQKTVKNRSQIVRRLRSTPVLVLTSLVLVAATLSHGFGAFAASCSSTADCQAQITSLNAANASAQGSLTSLAAQAGSFQATIGLLQSQIDSVQAQITANQAQQASLQQQIIDAQNQIIQQKGVLASDIKTMYLNGQMTPQEMLATSDNLSDYIDKQQAYSAVQDKIQETLKQIAALQAQLTAQKEQVDTLVKAQQAQQTQLASTQAQQQALLSYNQDQQNQFNSQITANKAALGQLYAAQAAIIAASFHGGGLHYGGTGGYPYSDATCMNGDGCGPYSSSPYNWGEGGHPYDPLGWQYRNCTSYAFWRLAQTTGVYEYASGFAAEMASYNNGIKYAVLGVSGVHGGEGDFQYLGYRVDHDPTGTAVLAVQTAGSFGHIMYVENGNDPSNVIVSQYNAAGDGQYSTGTISAGSSSIYFVHIR